jgi:DNA-binding CsgD family transcriptional regulator/PAS domain-containing protein
VKPGQDGKSEDQPSPVRASPTRPIVSGVNLDQEDFVGVLDLVRAVGQARDPDEFLRVALHGVMELVPCPVASINEINPMADRVIFWVEPASFRPPEGASEALADLSGEHPLIRHAAETGDGSAQRISDFWTQAEFHASALYRLVYEPMGVEYQISVTLPAPKPVVLGLALSREDRDFSERDRTVLNLARPHLAQAWRSAREQERLRGLVDAANDAVAQEGAGMVVLWDPPVELTPGALVTVYRFFGRPSPASPLPSRVEKWVAAQRDRLEEDERLDVMRPLSAEVAGRRCTLRYLPPQAGHPGAILVGTQGNQPSGRSFEALGLSAREAEIVRWVTVGDSNAAIATRLHLAPGTVKKHLDHVYAKLGVRGRGPLTAFVLDITVA